VAGRGKRPPEGDPVVERAFSLLGAFDETRRHLSLTELSRRAGMPLSSTARIAAQLTGCGALERDETGRFAIGVRLYEMAALCPRSHALREVALPYMGDLAEATRQHVLLAVLDGDEAVLVERLSGHEATPVLYRVGGRMPLHSTGIGLVLLAFAPPELQQEYLRRPLKFEPENKQLTPDQLRHMLADARRDRAVVLRRPLPSQIMTVATPIFGRRGETLAALSLVVPDQTLDPRRLIPALQTASLAIARGMGTAEPARLTAS
jgi:DNA-binding IclR family transcriptional regulator